MNKKDLKEVIIEASNNILKTIRNKRIKDIKKILRKKQKSCEY